MRISVIIPVYNAEQFLEKAVKSALQFDEVKEILLIEDGSPDKSLEVCKKLVEQIPDTIKLFQHPNGENHGAGATRNLGLEKASQEFIAFLDADDYYLPNRFDAEKELFKNPKIDGVFGAIGTDFLSEKGKEEYLAKFKEIRLTTVNYAAEGLEIFYGLQGHTEKSFGSFFTLDALTLKKECITKNNLKFNPDLRVHQDSEFIFRLSYYAYLKTGIIDQAIAIRGVHDDNRITKIAPYSDVYNNRQYLLYKHFYHWLKNKKVKKSLKKDIKLKYLSFKISQKKGLEKYISILKNIIINPRILKTRYRFIFFP